MQNTKNTLILSIVAVILVMLFLGSLFLIMMFYYNNKKMQMARDKQLMKDTFEKQMLESRLEIQDQTFNTISQEIHDNIGQLLSLVKVQINNMELRDSLDLQLLGEMRETISSALSGLRDIARSLNAERIHKFTFEELVAEELKRVEKAALIRTSLSIGGEPVNIDYKVKLILVRIVQESLQNIIKHAQADAIAIDIHFAGSTTLITIRDNGRGFDAEQVLSNASGLGLQNMKNRAGVINAGFNIRSRAGEGCVIEISLETPAQG